jgi:hypothetical protein
MAWIVPRTRGEPLGSMPSSGKISNAASTSREP